MKTSVLVIGKNGQVARQLALVDSFPNDATFLSSPELNLKSRVGIVSAIKEHDPDCIINLGAYTAVDMAEDDSKEAFMVNGYGVGMLAEVCADKGIRLIHVSTDFVFDGRKNSPYLESDIASPQCIYGASKLKGEQLIQATSNLDWVIIRTSWVYSPFGKNFVKSMLHLMEKQSSLKVVSDQVGSPTCASSLAACLGSVFFNSNIRGLYHWSDLGSCSWFEFASRIQAVAGKFNPILKECEILPCTSEEYAAKAARPKYSVLDSNRWERSMSSKRRHWTENLNQCVERILLQRHQY